jgi:hypothetical protein
MENKLKWTFSYITTIALYNLQSSYMLHPLPISLWFSSIDVDKKKIQLSMGTIIMQIL